MVTQNRAMVVGRRRNLSVQGIIGGNIIAEIAIATVGYFWYNIKTYCE